MCFLLYLLVPLIMFNLEFKVLSWESGLPEIPKTRSPKILQSLKLENVNNNKEITKTRMMSQ